MIECIFELCDMVKREASRIISLINVFKKLFETQSQHEISQTSREELLIHFQSILQGRDVFPNGQQDTIGHNLKNLEVNKASIEDLYRSKIHWDSLRAHHSIQMSRNLEKESMEIRALIDVKTKKHGNKMLANDTGSWKGIIKYYL